MSKKMTVSTKSLGKVTLDDSNYMAGGGEGNVYIKNGVAFKIYHDANKMLPIAKIGELSVLSGIDHIVIPNEIIYDIKNLPIGYSMKYLDKCEFLCKMFTKNFRDQKQVTPNMVVDLVTTMQKTLIEIHNKKIIVGDYNEMNFLLDSALKIPYHIDTDSWQTPSFKCTAIMPSVQDMSVQTGYFDENTDWYSWAVVTFQLYIGIHPYKGRHPNYKGKDFNLRIQNKISVFNPDVDVPANCQDFSVIPKEHLAYFKEVFEKGHRGAPPMIGQTNIILSSVARVIKSGDAFEVENYYVHSDLIGKVFNFKEMLYFFTVGGYVDFQKKTLIPCDNVIGLCEVLNEEPILVEKIAGNLVVFKENGLEIGRIAYEGGFFANGACYTVNNGDVVENTFERLGRKVCHITKKCDVVNPYSYKIHDGLVVQDIVGKYSLIIPYKIGHSVSLRVAELDGYVILDAKYESHIAILITSKGGKYHRFILTMNKEFTSYSLRFDDDIDLHEVNFTVLPNNVVVNAYSDEKVELFVASSHQTKEVMKPPFNSSTRIFNHMGKVIYVDGLKLKKSNLKKV